MEDAWRPQSKRLEAPKYVPPHRRSIAENTHVSSSSPRNHSRHVQEVNYVPRNPRRIGKRWGSGEKNTFAEEPVYYNDKRRPRSRNTQSQWVPRSIRHVTVPQKEGWYTVSRRPNRRERFSCNYESNRDDQYVGTKKFSFLDLPLDIKFIILSKSPVKSIMRFRCVSKGCYQITEDPSFVDFHLANALSKPPSYILAGAICNYYNALTVMRALYLVEEGKDKWRTKEIGGGEQIEGKVQIVGSCRGLLCLCREDLLSDEAIFIYNPITREYSGLPRIHDNSLNVGRDDWDRFSDGSISFGFDVSSKKYKVVFISSSNTDAKGMVGYIITLGETSWRRLSLSSDFKFIQYIRDGRKCLFFEGSFYWIISKNEGSGYVKRILVMDICQEKFVEINFIDTWDEEDDHYLVKFGMSLALIAYDRRSADMKIWVLEDRDRGIWNHHSDHNMLSFLKHARGLGDECYNCRIEGTIGEETLLVEYFDDHMSDYYNLFSCEGRFYLVAYTPRNKEYRFNFVDKHSIPTHFDIVSFVPSFVSLAF